MRVRGHRVGASRRVRLLALGLVVLAIAGVRISRAPRAGDIVLIVIDTLRADHVSLYGYERRTSPSLDAFARDAVTYTDAISPGTWTVPAHGSLFTGRWPSFHGAERVAGTRNLATPLNPEVPTLAELLSGAGFLTAAFVANGVYVSRTLGFDRGFAEFYDRDLNIATNVERALLTWLAVHDERLFVFLNILDPHEPYEPPPPYDRRFPGKVPDLGTMMTVLVYGGTLVTPELRAHFVSQYDGEIAFADDALGRILGELKRRGRYEDALIVVTSDHGELLGEHGLAGHGFAPYEQLLRVPLVVKLPRETHPGERVRRRVSTMGVFASILATVGVASPSGTQARTLDVAQPVWAEDVSYGGDRVRVGYEGTRKLVVQVSSAGTTTTSAYDLSTDSTEAHPNSDDASSDSLRAAIDAFAAAARPANPRQAAIIDPEREAKLRALGYVE